MSSRPRGEIRRAILDWYRTAKRDLPWRRARDPYAIWVSEVMLQQTRVATVIPFYERFLRSFPDVASLAAAPLEKVLAHWSGLGYYRRARSLHEGARRIVREHDGRVPDDPQTLLGIPGIGRYTAGAIASVAFDLAEPIVDGNVRRVLSRIFAIRGSDADYWKISRELVLGESPGDLNQGLMELGALVCTPSTPRCEDCPVPPRCRARATGRVEAFPEKKKRVPVEEVAVEIAWIRRGEKVLLQRVGSSSPLRGAWDLPATEGSIARSLARRGVRATLEATDRVLRHGILNRRLLLRILDGKGAIGDASPRADWRWQPIAELDSAAVSGATLKVARALGDPPNVERARQPRRRRPRPRSRSAR